MTMFKSSLMILLAAPAVSAGGLLKQRLQNDLGARMNSYGQNKFFRARDLQSGEELMEECMDEKKDLEIEWKAFGAECTCTPLPTAPGLPSGIALTCLNMLCNYCNDEMSVCALTGGGFLFEEGVGKAGNFDTIQYISPQAGRTELVAYNISDDGCAVVVNEVPCNSCEIQTCADGSSDQPEVLLDCSNVEEGAIHDSCANPNIETGVLEAGSRDEFNDCIARNDMCAYSMMQGLGPEFVPEGETFFGNVSTARPMTKEMLDPLNTCTDMTDPGAFGLWYDVTGEGGTIKFTTCSEYTDFDTQIAVYEGDCMGELSCVTYGDDLEGIFDEESDSSCSGVVWMGEAGVTYHVRVSGKGMDSGIAFMTMFKTPLNDQCSGAKDIVPFIPEISPFDEVTPETELKPEQHCAMDKSFNTPENPTATGVWYKIVGNGMIMEATTCTEYTNAETAISVYHGGCDGLECVPGATRHYSTCDGGPRIRKRYAYTMSWPTEVGKEYHILVSTPQDDPDEIEVMGLVMSYRPPPENGVCDGALPFNWTGNVGYTDGAEVLEENCVGNNSAKASWFVLEPPYLPEHTITMTTCSDLLGDAVLPQMDSAISVYSAPVTGDCSSKECVDLYGSFECANGVVVGFFPEQDKKYYIAVHGADLGKPAGMYDSGIFLMAGQPIQVRPNDLCANAQMVTLGKEILGSTDNATHFDYDFFCGTSKDAKKEGPGVWYKVDGTGKGLRASTCSESSVMPTSVTVFSGGCDGLECVVGSDAGVACEHEDAGTVTWQSQKGETYYILVSAQGFDSRGPHGLTVSEFDIVYNNECAGAAPFAPIEQTEVGISFFGAMQGSTVDATLSFDYSMECGYDIQIPGVWYTAKGTGKPMVVSTCSNATMYDSAISVFKGTCDALECVTGRDDSPRGACPLRRDAASVGWMSEEGADYYIYVYGTKRGDDTIGMHSLLLGQLLNPVKNDFCDIAEELSIAKGAGENVTVMGQTLGATPEYDVQGNGVWYKFTGDGSIVKSFACGIQMTPEMAAQMQAAQAVEGGGARALQQMELPPPSKFEVNVYKGTCLNYEKIQVREADGACGSDYDFPTEEGAEYLVIVSTARRSTDGLFAFSMITLQPGASAETEETVGEAADTEGTTDEGESTEGESTEGESTVEDSEEEEKSKDSGASNRSFLATILVFASMLFVSI